jgi:ABC-type sulfate transport system substrate-binding protein
MTRTRTLAVAAITALVLTAAAAASSKGTNLSLIAYSTPKPVMAKIIQAWQQTPDGSGVTFSQSYGPSTNQAKAVAAGQPADLVFLSAGDDVNPFSSGSAKWNILAAYGAERRLGKTDAQATAYVQALFKNVVSQDTSGSNATNTFLSGKGDVLITYESEAINANLQGKHISYVIPRQSMLIQLPVAAIAKSSNLNKVNQFLQYLRSVPAQQLFAQYGFRPVNPTVAKEPSVVKEFPTRPGIFKITDKYIGGWRNADKVWFNPSSGRMVKIEQAVGGPSTG